MNISVNYYSSDAIDALGCRYNMIIGERSNGKTYNLLTKIVKNYAKNGKQGAYVRRWKEDYRGKRGSQLFAALEANDEISRLTDGMYTRTKYYNGRWWLANYDTKLDKLVTAPEPLCFAFALSDMEHDKGISYPQITTIVFDEFLTRGYYLPNEFVLFQNCISTIVRHRTDVTIYMLANTVNKFSIYFKEMGIKRIEEMKQGSIDVYKYGNSDMRVAVEYCSPMAKENKLENSYFAFDNPALSMITEGTWELDLYPHAPENWKQKKEHVVEYFIIYFNGHKIQCDIIEAEIEGEWCSFLYCHERTYDITDLDEKLVFSDVQSVKPNWFMNLRKPANDYCRRCGSFFKNENVYYQDNEVGDVIMNYLQWCAKH